MTKELEAEKALSKVKLIELNEAYQKVLYWFFSFPDTAIGLNSLSTALQISKTTANKTILELEKEKFLVKNVYGKTWIITCNKNHPFNFTKKIAFNLAMVFEAYQSGLRGRIFGIVGNAQAVILFGSYRKGDDTEKSDVDIAVEIASNTDLKVLQLGTIPQFGYRKDVPVNLHVFCRNKIDIHLFSNIANGIALEGFLEVRI
ncbi:nucleotidyltransferase domain-containing protein [Candidatus Woesearchaeota archaeon]|nr:nucleotidyltransferase domain-containing protein [Candidatus Woesearchaeota archaeon]